MQRFRSRASTDMHSERADAPISTSAEGKRIHVYHLRSALRSRLLGLFEASLLLPAGVQTMELRVTQVVATYAERRELSRSSMVKSFGGLTLGRSDENEAESTKCWLKAREGPVRIAPRLLTQLQWLRVPIGPRANRPQGQMALRPNRPEGN